MVMVAKVGSGAEGSKLNVFFPKIWAIDKIVHL